MVITLSPGAASRHGQSVQALATSTPDRTTASRLFARQNGRADAGEAGGFLSLAVASCSGMAAGAADVEETASGRRRGAEGATSAMNS